jgi:hypothetical protein
MSYMDTATQSSYNSMSAKFASMMNAAEEGKQVEQVIEPLPMENGHLSKYGLLIVVREMALQAKTRILEWSGKFLEKRREFYKNDEQKYREVVMQQLQFNDMLIVTITNEICGKYKLPPAAFEQSAQMYQNDPEVRPVLESLAVESLQCGDDFPADLTRDKLREVLSYSCDFIEQYITEHPQLEPMEVILLKMREADEIDLKFGYNELIISSALAKYSIETAPDFEDIRNRLNAVT